ncbi:peptidase M20 [Virgisporangium aliadipatigenens]|uniref:Peptidase M20 n=1 Tax=Virgisporangium aliadipatigenens TaxID=741659 RepID=A0A8J3YQJ3_9ACTN|nr:M20/M25/M40 family metallo-hydrolase [Virgisporangium aliadipatigenens]GIJ48752.1 peptidase M20 [Virgisporangium aliadipatigenens]
MHREPLDAVRSYRARHAWRVLAEFRELLALSNVTGDLPALRRNAAAVADLLTARGARMEVVEHAGAAPLVTGRLGTGDRPTLGVYVHYDGQPVGTGWHSPPFTPTLRDGDREVPFPGPGDAVHDDWRLYSRAAADDKAPLIALATALDGLRDAGVEPAVDLVFCLDGEEESGSPHLAGYLDALRGRLRADAWLVFDGPVHHSGAPQVVLGVRGYCGFELTVHGPTRELHSGHFGNWVPNPALTLAHLLATFKDEHGNVTVQGFYDDTAPPGDADRAALAALPPVEDVLLERVGVAGPEIPDSRLADRLMLPSFNIRGLRAGDVGDAARNVVPATASASVDIRLAAGDRPERMLRRVREHLTAHGCLVLDRDPTDAERRAHHRIVRLDAALGYPAVRTPAGTPIVRHLAELATEAAGEEALTVPGLGGSLPLHALSRLDSPLVILPIANADNNQHAADENLLLRNLWYGVDLFTLLLTRRP